MGEFEIHCEFRTYLLDFEISNSTISRTYEFEINFKLTPISNSVTGDLVLSSKTRLNDFQMSPFNLKYMILI